MICHALVQQLPETAFGEAVESLAGIREFYRDSPALLKAVHAPMSIKAKVTGSFTAPILPVLED